MAWLRFLAPGVGPSAASTDACNSCRDFSILLLFTPALKLTYPCRPYFPQTSVLPLKSRWGSSTTAVLFRLVLDGILHCSISLSFFLVYFITSATWSVLIWLNFTDHQLVGHRIPPNGSLPESIKLSLEVSIMRKITEKNSNVLYDFLGGITTYSIGKF